jgi:hypothetical protein
MSTLPLVEANGICVQYSSTDCYHTLPMPYVSILMSSIVYNLLEVKKGYRINETNHDQAV